MQTDHSVNRETENALPDALAEVTREHSLENTARDRGGSNEVNIRLSLPLLFGRYYITIVAGPERRSEGRLRSERRRHPLLTFGNLIAYLIFGSVVGLALLSVFQLLSYWVLL